MEVTSQLPNFKAAVEIVPAKNCMAGTLIIALKQIDFGSMDRREHHMKIENLI